MDYIKYLSEYKNLLEIYNEDLEYLYELQEKNEKEEIEYEEYEKYADYMVKRYNYLIAAYKKIKELYDKKDLVEFLTNEDLEKQLEKLNKEAEEIWRQQVQVENAENPDDSLEIINKKINDIKEELRLRKENPLRGMTIEELQAKKDELYKKIADQQEEDEYHFRTHQQNGLEGYEDEIDKGLKEINEEIARRQPKKKEEPEKPKQPMMVLEKDKEFIPVPPTPVPPKPIPPIQEPKREQNYLTLEGIIEKVIGEESISGSQSKKYIASQIRIYNPMPKNNWGNAYKLVSIARKMGAVIMIPFNGLKKLIGKLSITNETKKSVKAMQERVNKLTDEEVEIFLNQYKGSTALGFRLPKVFNELMRGRIIKYITPRIERINNRISELLAQIEFHKKIADGIEERLTEPNLSPEERKKLIDLRNQAYIKCAGEIREMNTIKREGNQLQSGNGLHAIEEELNATNSKMNYKGGRFAKDAEIDYEIWKILGPTSKIIEHSNNPYEIVNAYFEQKEFYIKNTKEKRSFWNLGSKVTAGKLEYRPFVENLYYGNDPFITDLISSILLVSSAVNIANTIYTNIKNAKAIETYNQQIDSYNAQARDYQQFRDNVRNGGSKIEEGLISDIRRNPMDSENLAERAVNDHHEYNLGTQSYKIEDTLHHTETANLSSYCEGKIIDLTTQYNNGILTHSEFVRELEKLRTETATFYEDYISRYSQYLQDYSKIHPEFDYTSILTGLKGVAQAQGSVSSMTEYLTQIYEQSYNLLDFNNLTQISQNLSSVSLIPPILTTVAAGSKVIEEDKKIKKEANSTEWDKQGKFAELLQLLKEDKITKKEEVEQAIEETISTGKVL